MEDEIITVNKTDFSMRKILGEDGWQTYQKASDKVRGLARIKVRMDLSAMEIGFARLNALTPNSEPKGSTHNRDYDSESNDSTPQGDIEQSSTSHNQY